VRYELKFSEDAREQLRALPKTIRKRIGVSLTRMQADLAGDVKKLTGRESMYRLRVVSFDSKDAYA
jgi:mRNA-degrading endonuclease RelE of RelBE toxin-antitoxin system